MNETIPSIVSGEAEPAIDADRLLAKVRRESRWLPWEEYVRIVLAREQQSAAARFGVGA